MAFTKVDSSDYPKVKKTLERFLPHSFMVHNGLDTFEKFGPLGTSKLELYLAQGEGLESVYIFKNVCSQPKLQSMTMFWDTQDISDEVLRKLISEIPDWDWSKPYVIPTGSNIIDSKLRTNIPKPIAMTNITTCCQYGILLTIEKDDIIIPRISPEYIIKKMTPECAPVILKNWDVGRSESQEGIEERLTKYLSYGIFKKSTSEESEVTPVSWTLQYVVGTIGMTFTFPEYRRQGLAAAVTLHLARDIISLGMNAYACVDHGNPDALAFHQKIGFKIVGKTGLILRLPQNMSLDDL